MINRTGDSIRSPINQLYNDQLYKGSENNFILRRVLTRKFICEFQLQNYPFDTQVCNMTFVMQVLPMILLTNRCGNAFSQYFKGTDSRVVDLRREYLKYSGPVNLPQYYVKSFTMNDRYQLPDMEPDEYGVRVEIVLGRKLLNQFLMTYIPTMCICLVAFSTNYFRVSISRSTAVYLHDVYQPLYSLACLL